MENLRAMRGLLPAFYSALSLFMFIYAVQGKLKDTAQSESQLEPGSPVLGFSSINTNAEEVAFPIDIYSTSSKHKKKLLDFIPIGKDVSDAWDYKKNGSDWSIGMCMIGTRQSPVDLIVPSNPLEHDSNLSKMYSKLFSEKYKYQMINEVPLQVGDFFYMFSNPKTRVKISQDDNLFQIEIPDGDRTSFGEIFLTDMAEMMFAQKIRFHSPSEHTFHGPGNRRQIEMQIWHYSDGSMAQKSAVEAKGPLLYMAQFIQSNLNLSKKTSKSNDEEEKESKVQEQWRVISLTFMSEEIGNTTLEELQSLPSETILKSIADAVAHREQSSDDLHLPMPLNLQSLMMMLQLSSLNFFSYDGSQTTPGCEENVKWYVAQQPLLVSTETMLRFYKAINGKKKFSNTEHEGNFRTLQNVEGNMKNDSRISFVKGYPLQALIAQSLKPTEASATDRDALASVSSWFPSDANYRSFPWMLLCCIILLINLQNLF